MKKVKYKNGPEGITQFWIGKIELESECENVFRTDRKTIAGVRIADLPPHVMIQVEDAPGFADEYEIKRSETDGDTLVDVTISVHEYAKFWTGVIGLDHLWPVLEKVAKHAAPNLPGKTEILESDITADGHYMFGMVRTVKAETTDEVLRLADETVAKIEGTIDELENKVSALVTVELAKL